MDIEKRLEAEEWVRDNVDDSSSEFLVSLGESLGKYGRLTDRQAECVFRMMDEERVVVRDGVYVVRIDGLQTKILVETQPQDAFFAAGKQILKVPADAGSKWDYDAVAFLFGSRVAIWQKYRDRDRLRRYLEALVALVRGDETDATLVT